MVQAFAQQQFGFQLFDAIVGKLISSAANDGNFITAKMKLYISAAGTASVQAGLLDDVLSGVGIILH